MKRKAPTKIKHESGKQIVSRSKKGEIAVSEFEVKGIENLGPAEKKHLLLQLSRDRAKDSSAGPWEIVDVFREEWRAIKDKLAQPVEINIRDLRKDALFQVLIDVTQFERELETQE